MKFKGTISRIDSEGVKAKMDNESFMPYIVLNSSDPGLKKVVKVNNARWKEAEAQRREYNLHESWMDYITCWHIGDRIEGEIINNEIVNVKIIV